MFPDGSQAFEAKDFLLQQDEVTEVIASRLESGPFRKNSLTFRCRWRDSSTPTRRRRSYDDVVIVVPIYMCLFMFSSVLTYKVI